MKNYYLSFIFLCLILTMTSCTVDDVSMTDSEQSIQASTTSDPPSEGAGEEGELEPND